MSEKLYGAVLIKAARILDVLADDDSATITDIAKATSIAQPTVSKIVTTLEAIGYVDRDASGRCLSLGTRFLRYASAATGPRRIVLAARPYLEALNHEIDETIHLGIPNGDRIVYADKIDPKNKYIYMTSQIGNDRPLYSTGMGKAMLATYSEEALQHYIDSTELVAFTENTITDPERLRAVVSKARADGYAVDDEEQEMEGYCIGTTLMHDGQLFGAISASFPKYRLTDAYHERVLHELMVAKKGIESVL